MSTTSSNTQPLRRLNCSTCSGVGVNRWRQSCSDCKGKGFFLTSNPSKIVTLDDGTAYKMAVEGQKYLR